MIHPTLLTKAASNKSPKLGLLNSLPSPLIVDMIAQCNYDFVIIDTEHVLLDENTLRECIQTCRHHQCVPLIRIAEIHSNFIGKVLDAGAMGIVLSRAETTAQIEAIANAMKFPPLGTRGITGGTVTGYGQLPLSEYIAQANANTVLVPMIESQNGLDTLSDMLATGHVSFVMEGALDLALNMGLGPNPLHPDVFDALNNMYQICRHADVPFCPNPRTPSQLQHWQEMNCAFLLCGEDRSHFSKALRNNLSGA
ncbi:MAG: 4-hydroxy-2-oxovalerate aldolase [Betaproteobacteria bacterium]|jgi:4-hydroxy-2-oxoheptanedioate aldolase|nr:MAG: 4-hydroxy-2-oxovalerate aldolase [Betaproteobacteria bacterium]PZO24865.1 MAG: 4-hydroxy-2-oxovalerate aldolase [Betaproteobacteria bacterium]PZO30887.1 MAG: 4-hydroxy-2-oxovalerate aldolase [Betaproteobacteria bacterium]